MHDLDEASYLLLRARQEQALAERAGDRRAAAAHRELAMRYSVRAFQFHAEREADSRVR